MHGPVARSKHRNVNVARLGRQGRVRHTTDPVRAVNPYARISDTVKASAVGKHHHVGTLRLAARRIMEPAVAEGGHHRVCHLTESVCPLDLLPKRLETVLGGE